MAPVADSGRADALHERPAHLVGRARAADVDDEFQFHLGMRARELERQGYTPEAARQEALAQLRLDVKYLMFDLEVTRQERDELKTRLGEYD